MLFVVYSLQSLAEGGWLIYLNAHLTHCCFVAALSVSSYMSRGRVCMVWGGGMVLKSRNRMVTCWTAWPHAQVYLGAVCLFYKRLVGFSTSDLSTVPGSIDWNQDRGSQICMASRRNVQVGA